LVRLTVLGAAFLFGCLLLPRITTGPSEEQLCEDTRKHLEIILDVARLYRSEHGRWPELPQLTGPDRFFEELPRDPWDHIYEMRELRGDRCEVRSCGPDGERDTGDDIVVQSR